MSLFPVSVPLGSWDDIPRQCATFCPGRKRLFNTSFSLFSRYIIDQ